MKRWVTGGAPEGAPSDLVFGKNVGVLVDQGDSVAQVVQRGRRKNLAREVVGGAQNERTSSRLELTDLLDKIPSNSLIELVGCSLVRAIEVEKPADAFWVGGAEALKKLIVMLESQRGELVIGSGAAIIERDENYIPTGNLARGASDTQIVKGGLKSIEGELEKRTRDQEASNK